MRAGRRRRPHEQAASGGRKGKLQVGSGGQRHKEGGAGWSWAGAGWAAAWLTGRQTGFGPEARQVWVGLEEARGLGWCGCVSRPLGLRWVGFRWAELVD